MDYKFIPKNQIFENNKKMHLHKYFQWKLASRVVHTKIDYRIKYCFRKSEKKSDTLRMHKKLGYSFTAWRLHSICNVFLFSATKQLFVNLQVEDDDTLTINHT